MFCCMSIPTIEEEKPLLVDLKKILSDRAWDSYRSTFSNFREKFLKRDKFIFEVPDSYFVFEDVRRTFLPRKIIQDGSSTRGDNLATLDQMKPGSKTDIIIPEILSLDTVFDNDTAQSQMYKFRFEKSRRTEVNISFQKGFTMGGKANFTIGIPKVLSSCEVGAELELQFQVTKSEGQIFEETMVIEATSDITVGPKSCYTANVQMENKALNADFTVVTRMSLPQGKAPVYIRKKSNNELVFVYYVKNLVDIFDKELVPSAEPVRENGNLLDSKIDFVTEGVIKGTIACNHKIQLNSDEPEHIKEQALARTLEPVERR